MNAMGTQATCKLGHEKFYKMKLDDSRRFLFSRIVGKLAAQTSSLEKSFHKEPGHWYSCTITGCHDSSNRKRTAELNL